MKIEWLRCFAEIAQTKSINKAAENLFMSQPAATKMVQALENELGETLLERKKTGVSLTKQGRVLLHFAHKVLSEYEQYLSEKTRCHEGLGQYEGVLRLAVSSSLLQVYYKAINERMKVAFPNVQLHFIEAGTEDMEKLLIEDKRIVGLVSADYEFEQQWQEAGLHMMEIRSSILVGCVAKGSRYAKERSITTDVPAINGSISLGFARRSYTNYAEEARCKMYTTNLDMAMEALLNDDETCLLLPQYVIEKKRISSDIVVLPVEPLTVIRLGILCHQQTFGESPYSQEFLAQLSEELRQCLD